MNKIFVYGTLKTGHLRHHILLDQKFVGNDITLPQYKMYKVIDYPGLVEVKDGLEIQGEVWEVDDACLAYLDRVEGIRHGLYRREFVKLRENKETQVYLFNRSIEGLEDCGTNWSKDSEG